MPTFRTEDFETDDATGDLEVKDEKVTVVEEPEDEVVETKEETTEETPTASNRVKISDLELDDSDLPEDLRGKIKTGKDLLDHFNNTRNFARDLYNRIGDRDEPKPKEETETKPKQPLFTEDDLGIGADPSKVEEKLNNLVNERVQPYILSSLQKDSENNARTLLENENEFPYAKRFAKEILSAAARMDVSQTANPQTWKSLYNYVVGANHSILLEELRKNNPNPKPKAPAAEKGDNGSKSSKASKGNDPDFEARVKNAKLSPEQKMVAEAMGITEDAFTRQALKMGIELNGKL
jgi:hypothetical protein